MTADDPLWRRDHDRWAKKRSQFLAAEYDLDDPVALALAYAELGFSRSGIADKIDRVEDTAKMYLERAERQFGVAVTLTKNPDEFGINEPLPEDGDGD